MLDAHFTACELRDVIAIKHGFAFSSDYFTEQGKYVLLTPGNFREEGGFRWLGDKQKFYHGPMPDNFILSPGDMLIAMTEQAPGLLGSTFFVPEGRTYLHNQRLGLITITDPKRVAPLYLHYLFSSTPIRRTIFANASGTKVRHTSPDKLLSLEANLPALSEQRKIGEMLLTWDEAIQKSERLAHKKLELTTWFRTDLFTGRVRLKGHTGNWAKVLLAKVLQEHGLRSTGGEDVFSVSVHKGLVNQIDHLGRSFAAKETAHYNRVLPGDVVYTKSPTGDFPLGIIKQSKLDRDVIVSPLYGVFTPITRDLGIILDAYFRSPITVRNYLAPLVQKGAKNTIAITNKRFLEGELFLPLDPKEQRAIAEIVEDADAEVALIERQIAAYQAQKRGLMQKLLTGVWRVGEASQEVAA